MGVDCDFEEKRDYGDCDDDCDYDDDDERKKMSLGRRSGGARKSRLNPLPPSSSP